MENRLTGGEQRKKKMLFLAAIMALAPIGMAIINATMFRKGPDVPRARDLEAELNRD